MDKIISCTENIKFDNESKQVVFTSDDGFVEFIIGKSGYISWGRRIGELSSLTNELFSITRSYTNITPPVGMSKGEMITRDLMHYYESKKKKVKYLKSSKKLIKLDTSIYGSKAYAKESDVGLDAFGRYLLADDMRVDYKDGKQYHIWYMVYHQKGFYSRTYFYIESIAKSDSEYVYIPSELITKLIDGGSVVKVGKFYYYKDYADKIFEINFHTGRHEKKFSPKERTTLSSYHSGQSEVYYATKTPGKFYIGIEFEKWERLESDIIRKITKNGWRAEYDMSVRAEYITPILCLDYIDEAVEWIKETGQEVLDAEVNCLCGGHIHISHRDIDPDVLYRMMVTFMPILWAIYPKRAINDYCRRPLPGSNLIAQRCGHNDFVRRNLPTCELRIFPGLKGEKTLRFRLHLLKFIAENAVKLGENNTFQDVFNLIVSSEEFFDILAIVYNTPRKMGAIAKRILTTYKEVIGTDNTNDPTTFDTIPNNLIAFVKQKEFVSGKIEP